MVRGLGLVVERAVVAGKPDLEVGLASGIVPSGVLVLCWRSSLIRERRAWEGTPKGNGKEWEKQDIKSGEVGMRKERVTSRSLANFVVS